MRFRRRCTSSRRSSASIASTATPGIILKIGAHCGPSIAVTLNDNLDYFGQTVNVAARVQSLADAGEICISEALYSAPGVSELLAGHSVVEFDAPLRGVEGSCLRLSHRARTARDHVRLAWRSVGAAAASASKIRTFPARANNAAFFHPLHICMPNIAATWLDLQAEA